MAGLPASGKSALAGALSARLSGTVINKDRIRPALFEPQDVEYSTSQDDFVLEVMLQTAGYLLRRNPRRSVFLDGRTFSRSYQIRRVIDFAHIIGQPWRILECICSSETARRRLESDHSHPAGNRDFALYERVRAYFEPIELRHTVIDTDQPLETCIDRALGTLKT